MARRRERVDIVRRIELVAGSGVVEDGNAEGGGVRSDKARLEDVVDAVRRDQTGWERAGVIGHEAG